MSEQMIREVMQRQGFEADEIDEAVLALDLAKLAAGAPLR